MVLLKGFGKDGFRFFTNFESRKGKELVRGHGKSSSGLQRVQPSLISHPQPRPLAVCAHGPPCLGAFALTVLLAAHA